MVPPLMARPCLLVLALGLLLAAASPLPAPRRDLPVEAGGRQASFGRSGTVGMAAPVLPRTRGPARRQQAAERGKNYIE